MSEAKIVVCAPADSPLKARGSSTDRVCSRCLARVLVAPTGQAFLKNNADALVICLKCFLQTVEPGDVSDVRLTAEPVEIANEIASSVPNDWPDRN